MDSQAFLDRVGAYQRDGWRLAIINTTSILPTEGLEGGAFDVSWSFAKDSRLEHLRERVLPGEEVPSISAHFGAAFLYENEMRELFGVNVTGIALDLKGQLYKTATIVPFSPSAIRARLEALGKDSAGKKA
jgi:ech hydrogenase subunit D